jgi:predicted nucleotidyltransferase
MSMRLLAQLHEERAKARQLDDSMKRSGRTWRSWGMALEELLKEKREAILCICAKHGARNVRVFGSVARGEADEQSDIDLLVDMEPGRTLLDYG